MLTKQLKCLAPVIAFVSCLFVVSQAIALSDYGRRCDDNPDCIACKADVECSMCMNSCYNFYGPADSEYGEKLKPNDRCRKKQAKWCNAQCWDPDDVDVKEYISTKPECDTPF